MLANDPTLPTTKKSSTKLWTDHDERIQTDLPIGVASLQSEADIDGEEGSSGDDLLSPASKKQKAAVRNGLSDESENEDSSDDERNHGDSSEGDGERGDSSEDNAFSNVGFIPDTSSSQHREARRIYTFIVQGVQSCRQTKRASENSDAPNFFGEYPFLREGKSGCRSQNPECTQLVSAFETWRVTLSNP
jgi:hypothetical protein